MIGNLVCDRAQHLKALAVLLEKLVISSLNPQVELPQRTIRGLDFLILPGDETGPLSY